MKNNSFKNYFQYVQDVLGIKNVFFPAKDSNSKNIELLILVDNLKSYSPEESELLHKMIEALKLDPKKYQIVDSQDSNSKANYQLLLADQVPQSTESLNCTATYSPRRLLAEPHLKKVAWVAMQSVLKNITT